VSHIPTRGIPLAMLQPMGPQEGERRLPLRVRTILVSWRAAVEGLSRGGRPEERALRLAEVDTRALDLLSQLRAPGLSSRAEADIDGAEQEIRNRAVLSKHDGGAVR
jgi:hypothetical protein